MPVDHPSTEAYQEAIWIVMSLMLVMLLPKPDKAANTTTTPAAVKKRAWYETHESELLDDDA